MARFHADPPAREETMRSSWRQLIETRRASEHELHRICQHEAGHAVAAFSGGLALTRVFVGRGLDDTLNISGRCEWRADTGDIPAQVSLLASLSGPAADLFLHGRTPNPNSSDYRDARLSAQEIALATGGDVDEILARGESEAMALVIHHREAIKVLARAFARSADV